MGFFSKKITTDKIVESLVGFFDTIHTSYLEGIKDLLKGEEKLINKEQDKELLVISMCTIMHSIFSAFGEIKKTEIIIGKFQHDIFNKYFTNIEEKEKFKKLLWERSNEYFKTIDYKNKDFAINLGQIFCAHFFGKKEDGSHFGIATVMGMLFFNQAINVKKFLDEIKSKYEII